MTQNLTDLEVLNIEAYEEVEKWLFDWAKMNSHNADIEVGGYHETEGHDGWRIEEDGSLDGDGAWL